jgi:hypothetical protein
MAEKRGYQDKKRRLHGTIKRIRCITIKRHRRSIAG